MRQDVTSLAWSRPLYPFARRAPATRSGSRACMTRPGATPISGVIPGRELERMIATPRTRMVATGDLGGTRLIVLDFADTVAGYASYGRNRMPALAYQRRDFRALPRAGISGRGSRPAHVRGGARATSPRTAISPSWSGRSPATIGRWSSIAARRRASFGARRNASAPRRASASPSASTERARRLERRLSLEFPRESRRDLDRRRTRPTKSTS